MAKLAVALLIVCSGVGCIGAEPTASEPDVGGMYDPEPAPIQPASKPVVEAPEQAKPVETTSQPAVQPSPAAKRAPVKAEPVAAAPPVVEPAESPMPAPVQPAPEPTPEPTPEPAESPMPAPEPVPVQPAPVAPAPEPAPATPAVCQPDVCEDPYYSCTPPQTGALDAGHTDAGSWSRTYTLDSVTDIDRISLPFMFRKNPTITMKLETDLPPGEAFYACDENSYDDGDSCGAGTGWVLHKGCLIIASEFTVTCRISAFYKGNGHLNLLYHQPPTDGELKIASRCEYNVSVSWH